jgi:hypothetical protein
MNLTALIKSAVEAREEGYIDLNPKLIRKSLLRMEQHDVNPDEEPVIPITAHREHGSQETDAEAVPRPRRDRAPTGR